MPSGDPMLPETASSVGPDSAAEGDFEVDSDEGDEAHRSGGSAERIAEEVGGDDTLAVEEFQIEASRRFRKLHSSSGANRAAAKAKAEPMPAHVGRYRVETVLGSGGFGTVYLAFDTDLDRPVAVKVPRSEHLGSQRLREMFLREAKTAAKLRDPSLVTVYDFGYLPDGRCFVVMEYVDGQPLSAIMERGPVDFAEAVHLSRAAARALDVLHRQNVLHRDVKPANILVSSSGELRLTDFGLSVSAPARNGVNDRYAGTLHYMAPEQLRGESHRLDSRTDVWALGVVMYELFTGVKPFAAGETAEVIEAIQRGEVVAPSERNNSLPPAIDRVVRKCLAKRMQQRYQTAGELADELDRVFEDASPAGNGACPMPRGLRPFGPADAQWYPSLLPGLRDRDGLPESIAYWKERIETREADEPFAVGALLGPSGVGKSSFLRAGLMPSLSDRVTAVCVRAAAGSTAQQLHAALVEQLPELVDAATLADCVAAVRERAPIYAADKLLVVVDQFEQCLRPGPDRQELVDAFRQFDGVQTQLLLAVRDDYWLPLKRFMDDLDVELDPARNCAALDLFEPDHARSVLCRLGGGYGRCDRRYEDCSAEQRRFVDSAVMELEREGRVSPVQLSLFAEMHRDAPWSLPLGRRLRLSDIGVAFLQRSFAATPHRQVHDRAAQAVLSCLLPDDATRIVDCTRTRRDMLEASGYADQPDEFDSLLEILQRELRLVVRVQADSDSDDAAEERYQLSHDILVQAVRDWVRLRQEDSPEGRAFGTLARRNDAWRHLKDKRFLPSMYEWLDITARTDRSQWTPSQRALMRTAGRRHASRLCAAAAAMLLVAGVGFGLWTAVDRQQTELRLERLAENIEVASTPSSLRQSRAADAATLQQLTPMLQQRLQRVEPASPEAMRLRLAMLPADASLLEDAVEDLLGVNADDFSAVRDALMPYADRMTPRLTAVVDNDAQTESAAQRRLRGLAALAAFRSHDESLWRRLGPVAAEAMVRSAAENPSVLSMLTDWFRPVERQLYEPLAAHFRGDSQAESRFIATAFLSEYTSQDSVRRAELVLAANRHEFEILIGQFSKDADLATFRDELNKRLKPEVMGQAVPPPLSEPLASRIRGARGFCTGRVIVCLAANVAASDALDRELAAEGYRLTHFRPYAAASSPLAAAVWIFDGQRKPGGVEENRGMASSADSEEDRRVTAHLSRPLAGDGQEVLAADGWFPNAEIEALLLRHSDAASHLAACLELAESGYQPRSVAVDAAGRVASLWCRQRVSDAAKDQLASRQANAALALMRLAPADTAAWSMFRWRHDGRVRSFLIDRAEVGAPPETLLARLCEEADAGAIRGMTLAFGTASRTWKLDPATRSAARVAFVRLADEHADSGVHAAAIWAARQIGQPIELDRGSPPESANWYVDPHCGAMVMIDGPVVFQMGAPLGEKGRLGNELLREATIDRPFAIGASELTTDDYAVFIKDREKEGKIGYPDYYSAQGHPQTAVTWHQAAAYCNWLSERAGLPPEQLCYERIGFEEESVRMREVDGALLRTGYRLPSDAEWEYACRAGAATRRHYGDSDELLPRYGHRDHEGGVSIEVARLMPNDLGLFDTLGNAREWCHDPTAVGERVIRGGSFYFQTFRMRSASRDHLHPDQTLYEIGFRVARTLPAGGR